jgi:hypothetical protein
MRSSVERLMASWRAVRSIVSRLIGLVELMYDA